MSDYMIREMRASDWAVCAEIYVQGMNDGNSTFETACPTYEKWDKAHIKECRFVICIGENVAGFCSLSHVSPRYAYRGVAEVSIYMAPLFRGMGLGKALLTHLMRESEKAGYWSLYSCVISDNAASRRLHISSGFREIGYREAIAQDINGNWRNVTLYEYRNRLR